jgi:hypothetical protein
MRYFRNLLALIGAFCLFPENEMNCVFEPSMINAVNDAKFSQLTSPITLKPFILDFGSSDIFLYIMMLKPYYFRLKTIKDKGNNVDGKNEYNKQRNNYNYYYEYNEYEEDDDEDGNSYRRIN